MRLEEFKKENMAAWSDALRKHGLNKLGDSLDSNKEEDYARLKEFGLPVLNTLNVDYKDFHENNLEVMNYIKKFGDFVVLTIPRKKGLNKGYKIGLKTFLDIKEFVESSIVSEHELYYISLIEHRKNIASGIMISSYDKVVIEVADCYLDELSYGRVTPFQGIYDFLNKKMCYSSYNVENEVKRKLVDDALNYIKRDNDFIKGYFEFIVVEGNKIIFLDHKMNTSYWTNI